MPSKSKSQARLMAAVAHNPSFAKKVGIPQSVGKDFNQADKGKKFKEGGEVKKKAKMKLFGGSESAAEEAGEKKVSPEQYAKREKTEPGEKGFAKGGSVKRFQMGGVAPVVPVTAPAVVPAAMPARGVAAPAVVSPRVMKKGGKCMAKGGSVTRGDGVAQRGHTRGKVV